MTTVNGKMQGIVFDVQSFSTQDGPGIRTNIFLKGCPLRCKWCSNPESQNLLPEPYYFRSNCIGCKACVDVCKNGAISVGTWNGEPSILMDRKICATCDTFACSDACCNNAMQIIGKFMTINDLIKVVKRDKPFYHNNGGVTITGGDPLAQYDFTLELLKALKNNYVHTCVETEMYAKYENISPMFPYVDMFICDIKIMDDKLHKEATGVSNKLILDNLAKMSEDGQASKTLIRTPIIPGYSDSVQNVREVAAFCHKYGYQKLNILPYHKLGQSKMDHLHRKYQMDEVATPSDAHMEELKQVAESEKITCIIG